MKFETSNLCMNPKYRPCIVKGKKALFHRWAEVRKIIPPSPMIGGARWRCCSGCFLDR